VRKICRALPAWESNLACLPKNRQIRGSKLIALAAGLALSLSTNTGTAQNVQSPARFNPTRSARTRLVASQPPVLPPPTLTAPSSAVLAPPSRPTAEQLPLTAPQVSFADGQLTITAENSTLTDILTAVRVQMGAEIDAPPSTSREHMVVRLGPGPAREVIASLLSWTDYDYVIQAAEDDPAGVKSVLVTSRPKSGAASANGGVQTARRSPYSRAVESAAASTAAPTETPADDPVPLAPDPSPETAAEQQVQQPATQPEAADQQTVAADTQAAASSNLPPRKSDFANTQPGVDQATLDAQAAAAAAELDKQAAAAALQSPQGSSDSSSTQAPQSKTQEMIQQMQRLFQQRLQMQKMSSPSN
jgi:hypothetical protein